MEQLILHPRTKAQIGHFIEQPSHAVMLIGSNGIGKTRLAELLTSQILGISSDKLAAYPYFSLVSAEKDSISIDAIRDMQKFLQLKTIGTERPLRRAVVVEHAERLTVEAQNAYLKLLEEPPADTLMILTADNQRALLPTILSRVQILTVYPPEEQGLKGYFTQSGKDATAINQAYFLSGGLPGLMHALLGDDQTHPLLAGVNQAKLVLQKPVFERLALVEGMSKQREDAKFMLEALQHIAQTGLDQAAKKNDEAKLKQWHHILKISTEASDALRQNANTKLVLDNVMLSI